MCRHATPPPKTPGQRWVVDKCLWSDQCRCPAPWCWWRWPSTEARNLSRDVQAILDAGWCTKRLWHVMTCLSWTADCRAKTAEIEELNGMLVEFSALAVCYSTEDVLIRIKAVLWSNSRSSALKYLVSLSLFLHHMMLRKVVIKIASSTCNLANFSCIQKAFQLGKSK